MDSSFSAKTSGQRVFLAIGSIGPLGHLPASGTVTVAVVGIPLFRWVSTLPITAQLILGGVLVATSLVVHGVGDRMLGEKDSRKLVWDELAGFWIATLGVPFTWQLAAVAFFVERGLDVSKFPPAGWVERRLPGAWGVVGDDVIAGLYTCAVLHALLHWTPAALGVHG